MISAARRRVAPLRNPQRDRSAEPATGKRGALQRPRIEGQRASHGFDRRQIAAARCSCAPSSKAATRSTRRAVELGAIALRRLARHRDIEIEERVAAGGEVTQPRRVFFQARMRGEPLQCIFKPSPRLSRDLRRALPHRHSTCAGRFELDRASLPRSTTALMRGPFQSIRASSPCDLRPHLACANLAVAQGKIAAEQLRAILPRPPPRCRVAGASEAGIARARCDPRPDASRRRQSVARRPHSTVAAAAVLRRAPASPARRARELHRRGSL